MTVYIIHQTTAVSLTRRRMLPQSLRVHKTSMHAISAISRYLTQTFVVCAGQRTRTVPRKKIDEFPYTASIFCLHTTKTKHFSITKWRLTDSFLIYRALAADFFSQISSASRACLPFHGPGRSDELRQFL